MQEIKKDDAKRKHKEAAKHIVQQEKPKAINEQTNHDSWKHKTQFMNKQHTIHERNNEKYERLNETLWTPKWKTMNT